MIAPLPVGNAGRERQVRQQVPGLVQRQVRWKAGAGRVVGPAQRLADQPGNLHQVALDGLAHLLRTAGRDLGDDFRHLLAALTPHHLRESLQFGAALGVVLLPVPLAADLVAHIDEEVAREAEADDITDALDQGLADATEQGNRRTHGWHLLREGDTGKTAFPGTV
ncbi:MAG TPA: hypothetical protein VKA46_24340 [Gemmataceae bacterium]|nr:hypothetical protein [Gemmataceae bacterium]